MPGKREDHSRKTTKAIEYFTKEEAKLLAKDCDFNASDNFPLANKLNHALNVSRASMEPGVRVNSNDIHDDLVDLRNILESLVKWYDTAHDLSMTLLLDKGADHSLLIENESSTGILAVIAGRSIPTGITERKKGQPTKHPLLIPYLMKIFEECTDQQGTVNNWPDANYGPFFELVRACEMKLGLKRSKKTTVDAITKARNSETIISNYKVSTGITSTE